MGGGDEAVKKGAAGGEEGGGAAAELSRGEMAAQLVVAGLVVAADAAFLDHVQREAEEELERGVNPYARTSLEVMVGMTAVYLVGLVWLGQRYMKTRAPFRVDGFMMAYNAAQTVFNVWAVASILAEVWRRDMPFAGTKYHASKTEARLGFVIFCHAHNKYFELFDTVWMVLRKKFNQVSFLHVYHHVIMPYAWLAVLWTNPGGDAYFGCLANSFIHVLMYSFYLLTALKIPCPWKRYITILQLVQFCLVFVQGWYAIYLGTTATWLTLIQQFIMFSLFILFAQFYREAYNAKAAAKKGAKEE